MIFRDVHLKVQQAQDEVDSIQEEMQAAGYSDFLLDKEKEAQFVLQKALHFQEEFWKEKSRINWHNFRDRNSAFFHKVTKIHNSSKQMSFLKACNVILDKQEDIEQHALNYYQALFATENSCSSNELIAFEIPSLVSNVDNIMLTNIPAKKKLRMLFSA